MRLKLLTWIPLVGAVVALGAALWWTRAADARPATDAIWDDDEVDFVRRVVATTYVDELTEKQSRDAFHAALDGYLKSLPDDYNDFIPPDDYRRWKEDAAGRYAGIGVKIEAKQGRGLLIGGVFPGGPAATAGVRVGDVVVEVEGKSLAAADLTRDENVKLLKGPEGSRVHVVLEAPTPADAPAGTLPVRRTLEIVRGVIATPSVFSRRMGPNDRTGYIRIAEFTESTSGEFDRDLDAMVAGGITSVIVDLRQDGGGVLPATVHVADRFIRSGDIVRLVGRTPNSNRVERAIDAGTIPESIDLVVLVDGRSASASEVFAGCIQDHKRGVLLGTRTYGKFLVQNVIEIPGRQAAVKITSARYLTPNGRWYTRKAGAPELAPAGLVPDVVVEMSEADAKKFLAARENLDAALWGAQPRHPDVPADWVDPQLQRALELIDGHLLLQEIRGEDRGNG
jgi:carboxyl-terminal processing protease